MTARSLRNFPVVILINFSDCHCIATERLNKNCLVLTFPSHLYYWTIGRARILDWLWGAQTTNHIGENQKKRVFTVQFRIFNWGGGGRNLVGDQFWIGGAKPQVTEWGRNLKNNKKRSSQAEKLKWLRKWGEDQKKSLLGLWSSWKPNLKRELKTNSRYGNKFIIGG